MRFELEKSIEELETFDIIVSNITNPVTTKPSDPFIIEIFEDDTLDTILNENTDTAIVITSIPFPVGAEHANISQSVVGAGLKSTYEIKVALNHSIDVGGGLMIKYPT